MGKLLYYYLYFFGVQSYLKQWAKASVLIHFTPHISFLSQNGNLSQHLTTKNAIWADQIGHPIQQEPRIIISLLQLVVQSRQLPRFVPASAAEAQQQSC